MIPRSLASLSLSLALLAGIAARGDEVLLRRYEPITVYAGFSDDLPRGENYVYMDVEDTMINPRDPDGNYGAVRQLQLGAEGPKILVAFRNLNRAVTVGSRIDGAELRLTPIGPFNPQSRIAVCRVLLPWRDGGARAAANPCAATWRDRYAGQGIFGRPWTTEGAAAAGIDHAAVPSLQATLGDCWDADTGVFRLTSDRMRDDVVDWLGRHYRNYGWLIVLDPAAAGQTVSLASSEAPDAEVRPALHVAFTPQPLVRPDAPDLSVTFIERTPRYRRYHDNGRTTYERKDFRGDNVGIMKYPVNADSPKWPEPGDTVTFTAHVKNVGSRPVTGPVAYRWTLNDRLIGEGLFEGPLEPWAETSASIEWTWIVDHADHRNLVLEFEVDPAHKIPEITENNNAVSKYAGARTLKYWVEESTYEFVKDYPTIYGSYSFEDYLQWHMTVWNETYLDKSRFDDIAPDGCLERVTLDDFEIVPDGVLQGPIHRAYDKPDFDFDGEWGTTYELGKGRSAEEEENFKRFIRSRRVVLEGSLLHECSHQVLGAYDIYWSNIEASKPEEPVGKLKLRDETGYYIGRGSWYFYAGLMGGDDTRPNDHYWESTGLYAANSIGGFNTNLRFRNGFYGEWQYDMPRECLVRLQTADGRPIPNARVTIWQSHSNRIDEEGLVAADLEADAWGILGLPDQDSLEETDVTTRTGHTLRKWNPFGRPDVVGENITLLLRVDAFGQRDYAFVRTTDFNRGYWRGFRERYELPISCRICPSEDIDLASDAAEGCAAYATTGEGTVAFLTDGNVETAWEGGRAEPGDYVQIDLGASRDIGIVRLVQDRAHGNFYDRFRIEVADDRSFAGGARIFAVQVPWRFRWAMANDKDFNPDRHSEQWVTYANTPVPGRYLRITALEGGPCTLSDIRIHTTR